MLPLAREVLTAEADKGAGEVVPADAIVIAQDGRVELRPKAAPVVGRIEADTEPQRGVVDLEPQIDRAFVGRDEILRKVVLVRAVVGL